MSNWAGKHVIGLTGNIATGKSVVRKMLEHLGAYTIDADALSHRAIAKGAPGYAPTLAHFGQWILDNSGQIDRSKLGRLVFSDPEALQKLEDIVHPLVRQAIDIMIKRASQKVIVIEAIKLLESELRMVCDTIWVTYSPKEFQLQRLMQKRGMSREDAEQRITAQSAQEQKTVVANVVIRNTGSFEDTWKQVAEAWRQISPSSDTEPIITKAKKDGNFTVQRGRPRDSKSIAELVSRLSNGQKRMTTEDVMAAFGEKAFMLLTLNNEIIGLAGWQVENLVSRTIDLYISPEVDVDKALETLVQEIETASRDLQCEAALIFPTIDLAKLPTWQTLEYQARTIESLGVQAWQDAAKESMPANTKLLFKQLRQDRVLRPI